MMEDMVKRAERKLEELRRNQVAESPSAEEKAEMLADESSITNQEHYLLKRKLQKCISKVIVKMKEL